MLKRTFIQMITFIGVILLLFSSEPVHAIKSIPDGGATYGDGYRAYKDARKVNKTIKSMWDNNKSGVNPTRSIKGKKLDFVRGGKNPQVYSMWRGERLVYDIYEGSTNQSKKREWSVINSGGEPFFSFDGWAINFGHHHHAKRNQATYIGLVNRNNTKEKHIFKTRMLTNTNANADTHYYGLRTCPKTGDDAFNKRNDPAYGSSCNMNYNYTQFRAYIPLDDIFGDKDEGKVWNMYLIKRVEDKILYEELILPYDTKTYNWKDHGKITMESGRNTSQLRMLQGEVIKRKSPRGGGTGWGDLGYFVPGNIYKRVGFDESKAVANWFQVYDNQRGSGSNYRPSYENRWASSSYWDFEGSVATLSYEKTHAKVKIQHIDKQTANLLDEENRQVKLGNNLSVRPKTKGTFKDSDGNDYLEVPHRNEQRFNERVNEDRIIKFYYKSIKDDPSHDEEYEDGTKGRAKGEFSWNLFKDDEKANSKIEITNDMSITGEHYATRNVKYNVESNGINEESDSPQEVTVDNPNQLKNEDIDYSFEYEYTNHYRDIYKCVDGVTKDEGFSQDYCFEWEFDERVPSWKDEHSKKVKWNESLNVDHKYGENFKFEEGDSSNLDLTIGRAAKVDGGVNSTKEKDKNIETLTVNREDTELDTQTWKPIYETIKYKSDLNNQFYVIKGDKYYFPNDLDENLRSKYQNKNESLSDFGKYAIPLRVSDVNNDEAEFLSQDNFFITKKTGLVFSLPHDEVSTVLIDNEAKDVYEEITQKTYDDEVLTSPFDGESSRYYLNVDLNGKQKPNEWYDDNVIIGKLGLSDVTVELMQKLKFDNYLFGLPIDKPVIAEQHGSVLGGVEYTDSITLEPSQISELKDVSKDRGKYLHSFRSTDIFEVFNKIREIVPSLP